MKATELRIGNYVYAFDNVPRIIFAIDISFNFVKLGAENFDLSIINPIQLTPEFLLKLKSKKFIPFINNGNIFLDIFKLTYVRKLDCWYVNDFRTMKYITKVKYIHEWQNVVHSLTGEELTLTSEI